MIKHRVDIGDVFGRLTIIERSSRQSYFLVRCECLAEKEVYRGSLISGATSSCGCLRNERTSAANTARTKPKKIFVKTDIPNLPGELWKPVVGWSNYMISNKGRLKRLLGPNKNDVLRKESPTTCLSQNGRRWIGRIAVLILTAFDGPAPEGKPLARHLDDNVYHNKLENLAWGSYSDNMQDAIRNGKHNYRQTPEYGRKISAATTGVPKRKRAA